MVNVVERPLDKAIASIKNLAQLHTMENPRDCGVNEGEFMREIQKWHCQAGMMVLPPVIREPIPFRFLAHQL